MSYRGPALSYKIRKTTINNKTGDNYAITIPRIIAQQFKEAGRTLRKGPQLDVQLNPPDETILEKDSFFRNV